MKDYHKWVSQMQNNADVGNGDWGKSLLLLCYDDATIIDGLLIYFVFFKEIRR